MLTPEKKQIREESLLAVNLGVGITDSPQDDDAARMIQNALEGEVLPSFSIHQFRELLEKAESDTKISGLVLEGALKPGMSFAMLKELRDTIQEFKSSGKPVIGYLDNNGLGELYLKSTADELYIDEASILDFRGMGASLTYFGEAFTEWGIDIQRVKMGDYKTAGETFVRGSMSSEQREQLQVLLDDLWLTLREDIAESRGLTVEELQNIAEQDVILSPERAVESGLADEKTFRADFLSRLEEISGYNPEKESYTHTNLKDYQDPPQLNLNKLKSSDRQVGIVYLEGAIIDGKSMDGYAGGDTVSRHIREFRKDSNVKAIVLRVNSPGGSATASDKILREIDLANQKKPVVVSMGGTAASGGYWVSCKADTIFAQETTVTGSIGVIGLFPNVQDLANRWKIHFDTVKTGPFADMHTITRPKSDEEMSHLQTYLENIYDQFIDRVSTGRDMEPEGVLAIAGGRVWSGLKGVEIGLVDKIGGLREALQFAADRSGLGDDFQIAEKPRARSLEEQIQNLFSGSSMNQNNPTGSIPGVLDEAKDAFQQLRILNDPNGIYAILPYRLKFYE